LKERQGCRPDLQYNFLNAIRMPLPDPVASPDSADELDDPYIHTVSTEEFVQTVEQASQEETDEELTPSRD
jgi:hypothetical protein